MFILSITFFFNDSSSILVSKCQDKPACRMAPHRSAGKVLWAGGVKTKVGKMAAHTKALEGSNLSPYCCLGGGRQWQGSSTHS